MLMAGRMTITAEASSPAEKQKNKNKLKFFHTETTAYQAQNKIVRKLKV